jgi:hypothetical protein
MSTENKALEKVREKLQKHLDEGKFYECQQLYRSLFNRAKAKEGVEIALEGAFKLFEKKQANAGADLAMLAIDAYKTMGEKPSSSQIDTVRKLVSSFPTGSDDVLSQFLKHALKWTVEKGSNSEGSPIIHLELARLAIRKKDLSTAQKHYIRAQSPAEHCELLVEVLKQGLPKDVDIFSAKLVLQYLCVEDLASANAVFAALKTFGKGSSAFETPLLNFIGFLLKTVERDATPLFQLLRGKYAISIARDASLTAYLDRIGELYFGLKAPGMFDLLNML